MATKLPLPGGHEMWSPGDLSKDPQARLAYNRAKYSQDYIARKGWDPENPTIDQIMEIREQPEWKHAQLLPYPEPPVEDAPAPTLADVADQPPLTGDDLTAVAYQWGVERGEMSDEEVHAALVAIHVRGYSDFTSREDLEAALTCITGIDRVRVSTELDEAGRVLVLYQGWLGEADALEAIRRIAPMTMHFTIEHVEGKWPE